MKVLALFILVGLMVVRVITAQTGSTPASLDIMTTAAHSESLHSVPLKVSIPGGVNSSELMFQLSDDSSGEIFIAGTPYDSLGVNLPAGITLSNQYGESADLQRFRFLYGSTDDQSSMKVLPPSGCAMVEIPATGSIHLNIGGQMTSDHRLRGIYTGKLKLDCDKESQK